MNSVVEGHHLGLGRKTIAILPFNISRWQMSTEVVLVKTRASELGSKSIDLKYAYCSTISTRRFLAFPSLVELLVLGEVAPTP